MSASNGYGDWIKAVLLSPYSFILLRKKRMLQLMNVGHERTDHVKILLNGHYLVGYNIAWAGVWTESGDNRIATSNWNIR